MIFNLSIRSWIYWCLFFIYAGGIFVLSSVSSPPIYLPPIPHADKLLHALEFGLFSVLLFLAIRATFLKANTSYLVLIALTASIFYGAMDEYHQLFTPFRTSDALDLLADILGILMAQGVILTRAYLKT